MKRNELLKRATKTQGDERRKGGGGEGGEFANDTKN